MKLYLYALNKSFIFKLVISLFTFLTKIKIYTRIAKIFIKSYNPNISISTCFCVTCKEFSKYKPSGVKFNKVYAQCHIIYMI